jgi:hypothetical protein
MIAEVDEEEGNSHPIQATPVTYNRPLIPPHVVGGPSESSRGFHNMWSNLQPESVYALPEEEEASRSGHTEITHISAQTVTPEPEENVGVGQTPSIGEPM